MSCRNTGSRSFPRNNHAGAAGKASDSLDSACSLAFFHRFSPSDDSAYLATFSHLASWAGKARSEITLARKAMPRALLLKLMFFVRVLPVIKSFKQLWNRLLLFLPVSIQSENNSDFLWKVNTYFSFACSLALKLAGASVLINTVRYPRVSRWFHYSFSFLITFCARFSPCCPQLTVKSNCIRKGRHKTWLTFMFCSLSCLSSCTY